MTRLSQSERLRRATGLRDLAVDLVARGGKLVPAKKLDGMIEVMAYEGARIAIVYNTPPVDLRFDGTPDHVKPTGYMVDIWHGSRKRLSVQWENDGSIEILKYEPGDWEDELACKHDRELHARPAQV